MNERWQRAVSSAMLILLVFASSNVRASGAWHIQNGQSIVTTGDAGRQALAGDFDGDRRDDLGLWDPLSGLWTAINANGEIIVSGLRFGGAGDSPVIGDFDGDGDDDFAVWHPADGIWRAFDRAGFPLFKPIQWGMQGDVPLAGDFDGDQRDDLVIWRPADGMWHVKSADNKIIFHSLQWGMLDDVPLVGDFDGNGSLDVAVWRPNDGMWHVRNRNGTVIFHSQQWGMQGDRPVVADFDGDGEDDLGIWRPSDGMWHVKRVDGSIVFHSAQWGMNGDTPLPARTSTPGNKRLTVWRAANTPATTGDTYAGLEDVGVTKTCSVGLVGDGLDVLCRMPGFSCSPTPGCTTKMRALELFSGVTNLPSPKVAPNWNGFGVRGERMANAGLCLLKNLARGPVRVKSRDNGFEATLEVGFLSFDAASRHMRGYRRLSFDLPVFGRIDTRTQDFDVNVVADSNVGNMVSGDYPMASSYALRVAVPEITQGANVALPTIHIPTPVGDVQIRPQVTYAVKAELVGRPSEYASLPPVRVRGRPVDTYDLYGTLPGLLFSSFPDACYPPAQDPVVQGGGWASELGLGSRGGGSLWYPPGTYQNPRPDLDLTHARADLPNETTPSASLMASAKVSYGLWQMLPTWLRQLTLLEIKQDEVYVQPYIASRFYGQFDLVGAEYTWPSDMGSPTSRTHLAFLTGAGTDSNLSVEAGFKLWVRFCLPWWGCKDLVRTHARIDLPVKTGSGAKVGPSAEASIDMDARGPLQLTGSPPHIAHSPFRMLRTFHSDESEGDAFIATCLTVPEAPQSPPEAAYAPGDASELADAMLYPCNICIRTEEFVLPYSGVQPAKLYTLFEAHSNPLPPAKQWQCGTYEASLGCMDLCRFDPVAKTLRVEESAVDLNPRCRSVVH